MSSGVEALLSGHRALLRGLQSDIRSVTTFCETAQPEAAIEVLQVCHEALGKRLNAHGAGVDCRIGAGIMVLFKGPLPCGRSARNGGWRCFSRSYLTAGMVGDAGRVDGCASGAAIKLASRLCNDVEDRQAPLSLRVGIAVRGSYPIGLK